MLIAYVAEPICLLSAKIDPTKAAHECDSNVPVDSARILKQPQRNRVHRRVAPPLVKEPPRPVQMLEIVLIRLTPPELHIRNLEVTPEMTRRVPLRLDIMLRPPLAIRQPLPRIILHLILRMRGQEVQRLRPQRRQALRRIV